MRFNEGGQIDHLAFGGVYKSKGGSQQTATDNTSNTSGTSQTQLPPWLTNAAQQAVGTAQTLSQDPTLFNPYPGQQVADVSPGTQAGWNYGIGTDPAGMASQIGGATGNIYNAIAGMALPQQQQLIQQGLQNSAAQTTGGLQNAAATTNVGQQSAQGLLTGGLANAGATTGGTMEAERGMLAPWAGLGAATPQSIAQGAQSMMTPYANAVIAPTMQLGAQALSQNLQNIGAASNQAGAFGGTRQGVMEGQAQAQTALGESNILGNLLNTGYGQALTQSGNLGIQTQQDAFNAANQLAQLYGTAGNNLANMQYQGGSTMGQMQGSADNALAQMQYGGANQLGAQQATAGGQMAGYGQADVQNALAAGQGIPQQYLQNLLGIGGLQQSQQQALLNSQMGQYYGQQQQPVQNLDLLLSAVSGVPYGTSGSTTGTGQTSGNVTGTTTPSTVDQIGSYLGLISKVASIGGAAAGI
jgi:hypothetical protein